MNEENFDPKIQISFKNCNLIEGKSKNTQKMIV